MAVGLAPPPKAAPFEAAASPSTPPPQYWLLRALAALGALDRGVAMVHLCWGNEIAMGGTTFWEISHPDWVAFTPANDLIPNGGAKGGLRRCTPPCVAPLTPPPFPPP